MCVCHARRRSVSSSGGDSDDRYIITIMLYYYDAGSKCVVYMVTSFCDSLLHTVANSVYRRAVLDLLTPNTPSDTPPPPRHWFTYTQGPESETYHYIVRPFPTYIIYIDKYHTSLHFRRRNNNNHYYYYCRTKTTVSERYDISYYRAIILVVDGLILYYYYYIILLYDYLYYYYYYYYYVM